MKYKFWMALLVAITLAFAVTPAFAQGNNNSPDRVCFGGGSQVIRAGDTVRDVFGMGCTVTVEQGAHVTRDVVVIGGIADIAGDVGRDAFAIGGTLTLRSTASIARDAVTIGSRLDRAEGAKIGRDVVSNPSFNLNRGVPPAIVGPFGGAFNGFSPVFDFAGHVFTALALAALGILLVVFFPHPTRQVMATAMAAPAPSIGVGCLTMIVVPILMVAVAITLIGIPISVLLGFAAVAAIIFGYIAIGYLAGERILEALKAKDFSPILAVVVGVMVLEVVRFVPCLGWLIALLLAALGLGAVILTRGGTRPYPLAPAWAPAGPLPPAAPPAAPTSQLAPTQPPPVAPPPGSEPGGTAS